MCFFVVGLLGFGGFCGGVCFCFYGVFFGLVGVVFLVVCCGVGFCCVVLCFVLGGVLFFGCGFVFGVFWFFCWGSVWPGFGLVVVGVRLVVLLFFLGLFWFVGVLCFG